MRIKNTGVVRTHGRFHAVLNFKDLVASLYERLFQPLHFVRQIAFGNGTGGKGSDRLPEHKDLSVGNAGGDGNSAKNSLSTSRALWHAGALTRIGFFENEILPGGASGQDRLLGDRCGLSPKSEIRGSKEIRMPKPEQRSPADARHEVRISGFGFVSGFELRI
jgi:hypothetical protein